MKRLLAVASLLFASEAVRAEAAAACPYCSAPSLTLTQKVDEKDAAVLVQWAGGVKPDPTKEGDLGYTEYVVTDFLKAPKQPLKKGDTIKLAGYRQGNKGDLFLLFGDQMVSLIWEAPMEFTETGFNYLKQAPGPDVDKVQRLKYYLKFLEYPDDVISNDAYGEFAMAAYEDVEAVKDLMPRERLRRWVQSETTNPVRLGLYGLMLGMCGTAEDAELMRKIIAKPTSDQRLGIDGIMHGYLLLAGEEGLEYLVKTKLEPRYLTDEQGDVVMRDGKKVEFPFSEKYAALQAIRGQWKWGNGKISKDSLRRAMRRVLGDPQMTQFVVDTLALWEDWSVFDRLLQIYKDPQTLDSLKGAIIRYTIAATRNRDEKVQSLGERYLAELRKLDPDLVENAERLYID